MRLPLDLLPILVFAGVFKATETQVESATAAANGLLSGGAGGGAVGQTETAVMQAMAAAVLATLAQVAWLRLRRRRVDALLWFSLVAVVVLGSATMFFRDPDFIKWKPSVLYWAAGLALWLSPLLSGRNLLRLLQGSRVALTDRAWHRLNFAWIAFFAMMGLVNLWVAYSVSTVAWVNFRLAAGVTVLLLFTLGQVLLLNHLARIRGVGEGTALGETR